MDERYKTLLQRFVASLIDGAVLSPVTMTTTLLVGYGPRPVAIAWLTCTFPVAWAYTAYCHGRWGATFGKRIMEIAVVRASDEGPCGYRAAIRRDSGAIVLGALYTILLIQLVSSEQTEGFRIFSPPAALEYDPEAPPPFLQIYRDTLHAAFPTWQMVVIAVLGWLWSLAELATMMTNRRRRALHDVLGGTVVVKTGRPGGTGPVHGVAAPPAQRPASETTNAPRTGGRPRGW